MRDVAQIDRDTVLVVENDEELGQSLTAALLRRGFRTLLARDGAEALDALSWLPALPCLIVSAWQMPRLAGGEFIQALEKRGLLGAVPLLIMTSASEVQPDRDMAVLRKPFQLDEFLDAVEFHAAD